MATTVYNRLESPQDLIDYACRKLGSPVINIEVDQTQFEDRVDDAMQLFMQRHYDSVEEVWEKYTFKQGDLDRGYIRLHENITAVLGLVPANSTSTGGYGESWAGFEYQTRANGLYNFMGADIVNYVLTQQHISLIDNLLRVKKHFQFNQYSHQLKILGNTAQVGDFIIVWGYKALRPDFVIDIYNDEWLKKYTTALIKKQWGSNLKKFDGVQLPGGININGKEIYDEAVDEIEKLEEVFSLTYEEPVNFFIG